MVGLSVYSFPELLDIYGVTLARTVTKILDGMLLSIHMTFCIHTVDLFSPL